MPGKLKFHISLTALAIAALIAVLNFALWAWWYHPAEPAPWQFKISGIAYSGFQRHQTPIGKQFPSEEELDQDLQLLSKYTPRIRIYSSVDNAATARLAYKHDLDVTAGAWLDARKDYDDRELQALVQIVRENRNVKRAMVGNETLLRGDMPVEDLIAYLDRARRELKIPVSTAEPWHIWLKYPQLAQHVDFITVHLLPYWEGIPADKAVDYVIARYQDLQHAFPGKKIVIGEVGWPSNGERIKNADATVLNQAQFIREFLSLARALDLDYYLMEGFDQPWKLENEGWTGPYWGIFDAFRQPKFPLRGPVVEDSYWRIKAIASSLFALPLMAWFVSVFGRIRWLGNLFFCVLIQAATALTVWLVTVPYEFYLGPVDIAMMVVLLPSLAMMLLVLLTNGFEFAEVLWKDRWQRAYTPLPALPPAQQPFVSIHLPCYSEPPEMVILTLDSLAKLDYENFEVIVIDNNTKDENLWKPVEAHVKKLGAKFRFYHLAPWPGFKAGALNFALKNVDPRTEIVGVVDADYEVRSDWLSTLAGHFTDNNVAVVQAPQAHRDFENSLFRRMCNWEFDGFFRIGMHHRNERNAIIQHGTMTLIRKDALAGTGGWAEWCICEDAELGLRLMHAGFETRYIDVVYGRGLTPDDFRAFKAQRFRWAFGAMQILKRHWGWLLKHGTLTFGQRYHFVTGWASWFADALHLIFSMSSLVWTVGMLVAPATFSLPLNLFMIPILGFFVCRASFGPLLYRMRVKCSWADLVGASIASMGLSHAIACGVIQGLTRKRGVFMRTAKGGALKNWMIQLQAAREETLMFIALIFAAAASYAHFGAAHREGMLWTTLLVAQSLPYLASILCAIIAARPPVEHVQSKTPALTSTAVTPA